MSTLTGINKLDTLHKDLIHDISFNYYGSMLATCSSDQTIKIWKCNDDDDDNNKWELIQEINHIEHTHKASIQMITWANPIFGSIFASCSTDKKINIFQLCESTKTGNFLFQRVFLDFHEAICISFVPSHLGLKLSIVCNDGIIKILTARDITNLSQWNEEYSININYSSSSLIKTKSFSMCWNESKWELPSFAVGTNKNRLFIYKYFNDKKKTKKQQKNKKNIDWHCVSKIEIEKKDKNGKNKEYFDIRGISWSNHLGRKYHLIAIGCSDGYIRIIKIKRDNNDKNIFNNLKWEIIFSSSIHKDSVWKVKWNLTGNILLSAGDDAKIYLWKRNRFGNQKYLPQCISNGKNNNKNNHNNNHNHDEQKIEYH